MSKSRRLAYLCLTAAYFIYGAVIPLAKPILTYVSSYQYLFMRYLVAAPFSLIFILLLRHRHTPVHIKHIPRIIMVESISFIALLILYAGLKHTTALDASIIVNTRPIFITIAGILFLKEHEEKHEWFGLFLSSLGTTLVIATPLLLVANSSVSTRSGVLLVIFSNIFSTLDTMLMKRWYPHISRLFIATIHVWTGLTLFTAINLFSHTTIHALQALVVPQIFSAIAYIAIFGTVIGIVLTLVGYINIEASEATLFTYLEPLVYLPLTYFWLKEPVLPLQLVGLALAVSGVVIAELLHRRHTRRQLIPLPHPTPHHPPPHPHK